MFNVKINHKYSVLIGYFRQHKKKALWGGLFMMLNVLLILPTPLITMYLIDTILPAKNYNLLGIISMSAIALIALKGVSNSLQHLFFQSFNECVIFKIQLDLFEKVQTIPQFIRKKMHTGYIMSRIKEDPERLQSLLIESFFTIIKDGLTFIVGISIIFYLHWKLALISVVLLPLYTLTLQFYSKKVKKASQIYYEHKAIVSKKVQESISLLDLFKQFNAQKYDAIKFVKLLKNSTKSSLKKTMLNAYSSIMVGFIGGLGPILIIWYGIAEIMNGNLLLGELIAFNSFLGYLFGPTDRLTKLNINIQQSLVAWDRIYEYLFELYKEPISLSNKNISKTLIGEIKFNEISFSYDSKKILNKCNLFIPGKSTVAIIGESGCGKSTLVSLLTLVNTNYDGSILIDNLNIKDLDSFKYKDQIAIVTQEPMLFHNTIYNNIALGKNSITLDKIIYACKIVKIHDFVSSLPKGYDTILDERGINLSIGQKQRIALARAIVRDPKILILDEPTSNLDLETEKLLFNDLNNFIKSRTTIIITHRLDINLRLDYLITLKSNQITVSEKLKESLSSLI
ncbi:ABC transporter ATP-binding protein [Marinifilum caeruleilacunae]|uniref:ABC transporter ATP-binding protein n=1 Tax=Marinifilum caeruleilacunae TaxID=2499076 RepID=A0ABX1WSI7_9BACT|nr:ABC transporter ATP-binding protein [Marinifilum caeruleilacunae]NOU58883.1 ABC transporter ATP-binding protein [Marinifilum caeruleilacunae]